MRAAPPVTLVESAKPAWLQRIPRRALGWTIAVAVAACVVNFSNDFHLVVATSVAIYATAAVGQDWLFGRAGLVSLGGSAMMGVGAYVTLIVMKAGGLGLVFPIPLIAAVLVGGVVGLIIGICGLRFRGIYLLLTTLALQFVFNFVAHEYQGSGALGMLPIGTGPISLAPGRPILIVSLVVLGVVVLLIQGMYRSAPGRIWDAIREDEIGAAVMGISVRRWKIIAFIGSSMVTAAAGSLFAYNLGAVDYEMFGLVLSINLLVMVLLGGANSLLGPVLGAFLLTMLPYWLNDASASAGDSGAFGQWISVNAATLQSGLIGLAALLVFLYEPKGVIGLIERGAGVASRSARRLWKGVRRG